jgi:gluconate 2-dehydrogenase gamma chain
MSDNKRQRMQRRQALGVIAAAAIAGPLNAQQADHVHHTATQAKQAAGGVYKPKGLSAQEYKTLEALCEMIMPGAHQAGAAEFIDVLCSGSKQMAVIYNGGMAWINAEMRRRYEADFLGAKPDQRTALLDLIAWKKNASPDLNAGIRFFEWARRMTVDAYFTSKVGVEALGYKGNSGMKEYQVPAESLAYAIKRSPFA